MLPSGEKTVESTSLNFLAVSSSDAGTYICTADNGVGLPVTAVINLNVICNKSIHSCKLRSISVTTNVRKMHVKMQKF